MGGSETYSAAGGCHVVGFYGGGGPRRRDGQNFDNGIMPLLKFLTILPNGTSGPAARAPSQQNSERSGAAAPCILIGDFLVVFGL